MRASAGSRTTALAAMAALMGAVTLSLPASTARAGVGDVVITSATQTGGGTVRSGGTFDVSFTVTNNGTATAGPVTLEDQVIDRPTVIPFVSGDIGGTTNGARILAFSSTGAPASCNRTNGVLGTPTLPPDESPFEAAECVAGTLAPGAGFTMKVTVQANLTTPRGTLGVAAGSAATTVLCPPAVALSPAVCSVPAGAIANLATAMPGPADLTRFPAHPGDAGRTTAVLTTTVTPAAPVQIAGSTDRAFDNAGPLTFLVTLERPDALPVSVDYATVDGTAIAGRDYAATSGRLTFPAGQGPGPGGSSSQTIAVPLLDDGAPHPDRTFSVTLSNPSANAIVDPQRASDTGTILNDENTVAVNSVSGSGAISTSFLFTVTETGAHPDFPISVSYATSDDSATAGTDYAATSGRLTFPPTSATTTTRTVSVAVAGAPRSADVDFLLAISPDAGATVSASPGTGTITP